jgi:hypothetical protein
MSDKATLLTSIPPVQAQGSSDNTDRSVPLLSPAVPKNTALLSPAVPKNTAKSDSAQSTSSAQSTKSVDQKVQATVIQPVKKVPKVSLLSQTRAVETTPKPVVKEPVAKSVSSSSVGQKPMLEVIGASASETVPEDSGSLSAFQVITYGSFIFNFILAGAAAVILFKKATKLAEERFVISAKALAIACILITLHGFFATYLYTAHLSDSVSNAPLFLTMAVWVLVGPAVGFITRSLLTRQDKPNRKAAFIDAGIYALIFFLTACGVSSGIKTNAALLFSLMGAFLMIVPIARSLTTFKVAKARHKELNEAYDQILIYGLLLLPALLPVLAFAHVCGLSDAVTLFLINFITFDFVLVVGLSMIASADELIPEVQQPEPAEAEAKPVGAKSSVEVPVEELPQKPAKVKKLKKSKKPAKVKKATATVSSAAVVPPEPEAKVQKESPVEPPVAKPKKVATGNPDDPIIQFLNSEEGMDHRGDAVPLPPARPASKPAAKSTPTTRVLPPRKPGRPAIKPPSKPGATAASAPQAPNAPSRFKAPAKPKKRF